MPEKVTLPLFPPATIVPPSPRHPYYTINGEEMVRVTKVLGDTQPKPYLVPWAKGVALEAVRFELLRVGPLFAPSPEAWPQYVENILRAAAKRPDEKRDEAAEYGTRMHKLLQAYLKDGGIEGAIDYGLVVAFDEARKWLDTRPGRVVAVEQTVWNRLTPETGDVVLSYAGTVDVIWENEDGTLDVGDWKSAKAIWPEAAEQLGAYAGAVEQLTSRTVRDCWVMRVPKEQPEPGVPLFEAARLADWRASYEDFLLSRLRWERAKRKVYG